MKMVQYVSSKNSLEQYCGTERHKIVILSCCQTEVTEVSYYYLLVVSLIFSSYSGIKVRLNEAFFVHLSRT